MIVILDTAKGQSHNFKTRKDAGEFIGVSLPTLRGWLGKPFYLHKSLIITHTSNEKVIESKRSLLKKQVAQFRQEAIERHEPVQFFDKVQGDDNKNRNVPVNSSRQEKSTGVANVVTNQIKN